MVTIVREWAQRTTTVAHSDSTARAAECATCETGTVQTTVAAGAASGEPAEATVAERLAQLKQTAAASNGSSERSDSGRPAADDV